MKETQNSGKTRRTKSQHRRLTIGLLAHGTPVDFDNLWIGMVETAREQGVNLSYFVGGMLHSPFGFEPQANMIYDLVGPENVDGLIITGILAHYTGPEAMKQFCERYAPLPMVTQEIPVSGIPSVLIDFYQGMYNLLIHLIEIHGYHRIAYIRGPKEALTAEERYRAYADVLNKYDIPLNMNLVTPGTFFAPSGEEAIYLLFDERKLRPQVDVEAIVTTNDYMALDALQALHTRGIRVPDEVAIVGFDDIEQSRSVTPPLTTVQMPSYEEGRPLVDLLLARLDGKEVPDQVKLPTKLIIRESCGCVDPVVVRTRTNLVTSTGEPFETSLVIRREEILLAMTQVMGRSVIGLAPDWAEQLLDAFSSEVMNKLPVNSTRSHFLFTLDTMLHQVATAGGDMALWKNVLSTMRCQLLPCLGNKEMGSCAENLWHRAQMRIGGIAQRVQMYQKYQARQQAQTLHKIEHRLITTFDINGLMDILAEELPRLGIPGCYLSLYETNPEPVEGNPQPAPEWSRLILAYNENGRIELEPGGRRFLSRQLVPEGIFPQERFSNTIIEPLYFQENQLGFVLFEVEAQDRMMCDVLRGQISSALQGALLVQQVKAHEAELVRKQYILDIFMENVPDRIYFKDCDGRITRANKSHALRFGLSNPAEEIGKTDFDLFTEEGAWSKYQQEQEIIRTGRPLLNVEEHTVWPDGRVDWSLSTKMPLRDEHGEIIGTFGISRDITALKQAEHELRQYRDHLEDLVRKRTAELTRSNARLHEEIIERRRVEGELTRSNARLHDEIIERRRIEHVLRVSEQQYRMLAENVKDGIVIVQHGKLVFANMISATITGYPPEHLIGIDPVSLFQITDKQSLHTWLKPGSDGSPELQKQVELITRDGNTIWTEIVQSEIVWNGQPAILLTIRDITDRKLREQHLEEERVRLQQENISLRSTIKERYRFGALVGKSPAMQRVYELILSAATSDVNVLVYGESGTGKELIARTLHQLSWRKTQAFVPVNCASIPETLFEREFFGHHKGAFTGADRDKSGLFDRAHQGILFLDEVTELSPGAQAKLLRVLQDGEYTPLGSNTPKQADVLLVAATNKEYQMEIKQGRLRKDFFYRICVIEISVPPLQERKEDLPLLIEHILEQYRRKQAQMHGSVPLDLPADQTMLPGEFVQALYAYHWPGNVRELQNVVQRYLATQDLTSVLSPIAASGITRAVSHKLIPPGITLPEAVKAFEKQMIADTLAHNRNHTGKTAKMLGIPLRTLQYKINSYRLKETG